MKAFWDSEIVPSIWSPVVKAGRKVHSLTHSLRGFWAPDTKATVESSQSITLLKLRKISGLSPEKNTWKHKMGALGPLQTYLY